MEDNLFSKIKGLTIVSDNAKTHRSAFQQETLNRSNRRRQRRRRSSPPSSTNTSPVRRAAPPTSRWDSSPSTAEARPDRILKTPIRSFADDSDSESNRSSEELFIRPSNIKSCQSWPSPKGVTSIIRQRPERLLPTTGDSQDTLNRFTIDRVRRQRVKSLPILESSLNEDNDASDNDDDEDERGGVERSHSLQDWFTPAAAVRITDQGRRRQHHWNFQPNEDGESEHDTNSVLQAVFETLQKEIQETPL